MTRRLAERLLEIAGTRGLLVATAESCTGGMVAAAITDIPGSSRIFDRGAVTYSNAAKTEMLGVPEDLLARHGAVSEPVARAMAAGVLERSAAHLAVATTGIAGPGPSEHKPEGRVCFGLAVRGGEVLTETVEFGPLGRDTVRLETTRHALRLLIRAALNATG